MYLQDAIDNLVKQGDVIAYLDRHFPDDERFGDELRRSTTCPVARYLSQATGLDLAVAQDTVMQDGAGRSAHLVDFLPTEINDAITELDHRFWSGGTA